jgi:hypothetical protein
MKPWNAKGAKGVAVRRLVDLARKFGSNGCSAKKSRNRVARQLRVHRHPGGFEEVSRRLSRCTSWEIRSWNEARFLP